MTERSRPRPWSRLQICPSPLAALAAECLPSPPSCLHTCTSSLSAYPSRPTYIDGVFVLPSFPPRPPSHRVCTVPVVTALSNESPTPGAFFVAWHMCFGAGDAVVRCLVTPSPRRDILTSCLWLTTPYGCYRPFLGPPSSGFAFAKPSPVCNPLCLPSPNTKHSSFTDLFRTRRPCNPSTVITLA